ncbi:MAG: pyrimidine dimer DNA glycosylase/endonuclease V [Actinomycetota bacterium]
MTIWHEKLIPKLCRQHLLASWKEARQVYLVIINQEESNYPQVKEFQYHLNRLIWIMYCFRRELIARGYHPKRIHDCDEYPLVKDWNSYRRQQSLHEQIEALRLEKCECEI